MIDLQVHWLDVRRIFLAHFGRQVRREGYDPEEVLQEVYLGVLVRNQGKCPFDADKGKFGSYVYRVCYGVWLNYRDKHGRARRVYGALGDEEDLALGCPTAVERQPGVLDLEQAADEAGLSVDALARVADGEDEAVVLQDEEYLGLFG